jgi:RNA polymerase sigma-70 factor (ECF subfamily)
MQAFEMFDGSCNRIYHQLSSGRQGRPYQDRPTMSARDSTIEALIVRLRTDNEAARVELLNRATDRLARLTRKMLRDYPGVHRWEQTDDVLQNAMIRLFRALQQVSPPTIDDFFRLAAVQIRRELIDLARHYSGPLGPGANYSSRAGVEGTGGILATPLDSPDSTFDPSRLAEWTDFHLRVEALPDEMRTIVDLLFYQGLSQEEAAAVLGVTSRTVKRYWRSARLIIYRALDGRMPGE